LIMAGDDELSTKLCWKRIPPQTTAGRPVPGFPAAESPLKAGGLFKRGDC